mgnify:CR=1 FL=1
MVQEAKNIAPLDIFVPVHGNYALTTKCIASIYQNTQTAFHLIVLDNTRAAYKYGSSSPIQATDAISVPAYFHDLETRVNNLTYQEWDYPVKNGNIFFEKAFTLCKSDYMATVMNSVVVEPEWEIVGMRLMEQDPQIGIIGFKNLFPEGGIESAGIWFRGHQPSDYGRDLPAHRCNEIAEVVAVQWAFALVRKKAAIGNLDLENYHGHVGWDDIDNCLEVKKRGWKIVYCGLGVGYHHPRATRGSNSLEAFIKNKENAHVFYKKWGLWNKYMEAINIMDVAYRISANLKQTISTVVMEAQLLQKLLEEKQKQLSLLSKDAMNELNVSPEDYSLEVNPLAAHWVLKPKKLPPPPEDNKVVQVEELETVEV